MRVSVIIPNFDKERSLAACLDAVHAQTAHPAEVIVVDDASSDAPAEIAARYNVRLLRYAVNRGVSHARNRGAEAASGVRRQRGRPSAGSMKRFGTPRTSSGVAVCPTCGRSG